MDSNHRAVGLIRRIRGESPMQPRPTRDMYHATICCSDDLFCVRVRELPDVSTPLADLDNPHGGVRTIIADALDVPRHDFDIALRWVSGHID